MLGRAYARVVGRVEHARDAERNRVAQSRIARALGVSAVAAESIYRRCLQSEALEEADSAHFMQRPALDAGLFDVGPLPEPSRAASGVGTIYATLHFGSPVFGYLALRCVRGEAVSMVGRPLDESNPMPEAKRRYARGKVRWVESVAATPFIGTDGVAMARAREELLAGRSLYTPVDVPGSVAGRAATVRPFDEPVRLASGLMRLAGITGADVVPVIGLSRPRAFEVRFGPRLPASAADALLADTMRELAVFIRAHPDEWWMWPYLERGE